MSNIKKALSISAIIMAGLSLFCPQLPGAPLIQDILWMEETWEANGSTFCYSVYLQNSIDLGRLVLPLEFLPPADMWMDSISLTGTRLEGLGTTSTWYDNITRQLYLDFTAKPGLPLTAGNGVIAYLCFSTGQQAPSADVIVDTTFILPDKIFYAEDAGGLPVSIDFQSGLIHIVTHVPIIHLQPIFFCFSAVEGVDPDSQCLMITNLGIDPLNWHFSYLPTWLDVSQQTGTAPDTVWLTPNVSGLAMGNYSDSLAVTDSLSANHTLWAYIDLEITEPSVAGLAGWVRDTTWLGISNAVVEVWDVFPTGLVLFSTTSGLDGAFSLPAVPNGSYQLYAYKDHYYPTMIPVTAPDDSVIVILQPTPNPVPSSEWINLYCNENYFEGNLLPVGSVVEAYDQSGTICGQFFVHTVGAYGQMRVYRDDPNTPATDEGAEVGEVIEIRINTVPAVAWPIPTWTYHNDLQEVCLNTTIIETVCIDLNTGWNLISWNVDTYSDEIETVIADVIGCVDVVLGFESGSLTYDPDLPQFSTLDHVDHHHGYWFRMDCPGRLCVTGIPVDPQMPIDLETNWNLVSYLPNHQEDIEVALSSVMASLIVAHGFDGGAQSYEPAHPELATLTVLKPTFGYWLKTTAPATLIYPAMPPLTGCLSTDRGSMKAAPFTAGIIPTPEWVNVYGDNVTLDGVSLPAGTNLQMYDEEGTLCGQYHLINEGEVRFTPVYLDDKHSMIDEGADYGSEISIVVNGIRAVESFTWTAFGDRIRLGTLTSTTKAETMLPRKFELAQNYPNPFNPQTTIRFALPEVAPVKVEVFNLLGERVAGLIDELLPASDYAINWDGQLANGDVAPSGIYFYRLTTPQFSAARKMILLK